MTARHTRFSCALVSLALASLVMAGCGDAESSPAATDVASDVANADTGDSSGGPPDVDLPDTAIEPDVTDTEDTGPEPDAGDLPDTPPGPDATDVGPDADEDAGPDAIDPDVTDEDTTAPCLDCPTNHPCVESSAPSSTDEAVNACVCAKDAYCCDTAWDEACAGIAQADCGVVCDCKAGSECATDADCAACGGSVCTGAWSCVAGGCAQAAPLVCVDDTPDDCLVTECSPAASACITYPDADACDDGDPCTTDFCAAESGACENVPVPGCPGGDPCVVHAPGSTDAAVTVCVCALDDYCCTTEWDETCIGMATGACGHVCHCDDATPDALPCVVDSDCAACSADACASPWACVAGTCTAGPAVVCDTLLDSECIRTECNPASGACEVVTGNTFCDDGEPCTTDHCVIDAGTCIHEDDPLCGLSCSEDAVPCKSTLDCAPCSDDLCLSAWECQNDVCTAKTITPCVATGCDVASCEPSTGVCTITPLPCGQEHPCVASASSGTNDPAVAECVCALDDTCCLAAWDATCVSIAVLACGVSCDCQENAMEHPCEVDADCAYCGDTVCGAGFTCSAGVCAAPEDTCPNAPPFVCKGASEPAATGCDTVGSGEGCCDAWGRVVWCDGGDTYCIDCESSKIPSCGWSPLSGFYDCATDGAEESTGTYPIACGL